MREIKQITLNFALRTGKAQRTAKAARACSLRAAWAALLLAAAVLSPAQTQAQTPVNAAYEESLTSGFWEGGPDPLPGLPRPGDQPDSLFRSAPAVYSCDALPGPYCDGDPRLDPSVLPQPGWVADAELGIVVPRMINNPRVAIPTVNGPTALDVHTAPLDWTASPRLELGHRLCEGLGEFVAAYRFLGSEGTGSGQGPDAPDFVRSRLFINALDLDYASNELSICRWWMKWHLGMRAVDVFLESTADEPVAAAAAGSGFSERRFRDHFWGVGMHATLDLERRIDERGFFVLARVDAATMLGRVTQSFTEVGTAPGTNVELHRSNAAEVPVINASFGAGWRPPRNQCLRLFLGYQFEYWWNVARVEEDAGTQIYDQGVLLRADYNY